jgi:hypothetical protein
MGEFKTARGNMDSQTPKKMSEFEGCPDVKDKNLKNDDSRVKEAIHGN